MKINTLTVLTAAILIAAAAFGDDRPALMLFTDRSGNERGLKGEYFQGTNFQNLNMTRTDKAIRFNWKDKAPAGLEPDEFSIRWTGFVQATVSGNYKFAARTDDGTRVWVNNKRIINFWKNRAAETSVGKIYLEAGTRYPFKMEYYENKEAASARLGYKYADEEPAEKAEKKEAPHDQPRASAVPQHKKIQNWNPLPGLSWNLDCRTAYMKLLESSLPYNIISALETPTPENASIELSGVKILEQKNADVKIQYSGNRMSSISMDFHSADAKSIISSLKETYGKPSGNKPLSWQARQNGRELGITLKKEGDAVSLVYTCKHS